MSLAPAKLAFSILAIASFAYGAFAQVPAYPERPVSMVVTFAAGGSSDVLARAVADAMSGGLGRQIAVDNRPGAGGQIGAEAVATQRRTVTRFYSVPTARSASAPRFIGISATILYMTSRRLGSCTSCPCS